MENNHWTAKISALMLVASSLFILMYIYPKVLGVMVLFLFVVYLSKVWASR